MKKVLIIGASGFLGSELYKVFNSDNFYKVYGTYSKNKELNLLHLDMSNIEAVKGIFENIVPDIVIITAALTNVEYCEKEKQKSYEINVGGIKNISSTAREYNCKVVYVSTEYVFDGQDGPYSEEDMVNPISYYGKTKLLGEKIVQDYIDDYIIVRTTVVYGWDLKSKNFIMQLINNLSSGNQMKVPVDQISSPTYCPNLALMIKESCDKNITGVFNMVGRDVIGRYDFAVKAAEILNLKKSLLLSVETKELGQVAERPLNAGLKIDKISEKLSCKPMGVIEGLAEVKKFYDRYKSRNCEDSSYE